MNRTRAADDFAALRARIAELRSERERASSMDGRYLFHFRDTVDVEEVSYYREQALRASRLAAGATQADIRIRLARLARQFAEVAEDLELGTTVRHPELLQCSKPES